MRSPALGRQRLTASALGARTFTGIPPASAVAAAARNRFCAPSGSAGGGGVGGCGGGGSTPPLARRRAASVVGTPPESPRGLTGRRVGGVGGNGNGGGGDGGGVASFSAPPLRLSYVRGGGRRVGGSTPVSPRPLVARGEWGERRRG